MMPLDLTAYRPSKAVLVTAIGVLVVMGVTFGAGYWYAGNRNQAKVSQAETQANIAKGEADALKRQAEAKDQEIAAKDAGIEDARAHVARSDREVERLRKLSPRHDPAPPEGDADPQPITPPVDLAPLVSALEQANADKAYFIKGLETKISDLVISRDAWKESEAARSRETAGLRIALEAQKSLTRNALWTGRIQGLAIGLGSGYVIGRAQR